MSHRSLCQEAHERLLAREEVEGDALDLVLRVADAVSRRLGSVVTGRVVLWVEVELALQRHRRARGDVELLRDVMAHLDVLARLEAADAPRPADPDDCQRWRSGPDGGER